MNAISPCFWEPNNIYFVFLRYLSLSPVCIPMKEGCTVRYRPKYKRSNYEIQSFLPSATAH